MTKITFTFMVGITFVAISFVSLGSQLPEKKQLQAISDLTKKEFLITTKNGKKSMVEIPASATGGLATKGYGKPCENNVARLNVAPGREAAAVQIPEAPYFLAFLDCPANNDGGAGSVAALFDYNNTSIPQCFNFVDLMGESRYYWWGMVRSLAVQNKSPNEFFVAVTLSGADAGDAWTSFAFFHMNSECKLTPLAKFYASTHADVPEEKNCKGNTIGFRFVDKSSIEIRREQFVCPGEKRTEKPKLETFDLNAMLVNPKARIIEPK